MPVAIDKEGNAVRLDEGGEWVPTETAKNPQTGEVLALDGSEWVTAQKQPRGALGFLRDANTQLAQGATFGYIDEGAAQAQQFLNEQLGLYQDMPYEERLAGKRGQMQSFERDYPKTSLGLQVAGGVGSALAAGPLAGTVAGLGRAGSVAANLPGWVKAMGIGGAAGGLAGSGYSEEGGRLEGAAAGGVLGATLGGVGVGIGKLLQMGGKRVINPILDRVGDGPKSGAVRRILRALRRDDMSMDEAIRRMDDLGDEAVLADVGPNMSGLAESAAQRPGVALTEATETFANRRGGQAGRVLQYFDDAIGPTGREVVESVEESPAFRKALQQHIPVSDDLLRFIRRPSLGKAWQRARQLAKEGDFDLPSREEFLRRADDGEITGVETTVMHWLKKGLDDVIEPKRNAMGVLESKYGANELRAMRDTRSVFRGLVKDANPSYGASLDRISRNMRIDDAYRKGLDFMKMKGPEQVTRQMRNFTPQETRAYQRGIRDTVENKIADQGVLGYDVTRFPLGQGRKLAAAFGDDADDLLAGLRNERTLAQNENRIMGNSRTAFRQAAGDDMGIDPSVAVPALQGDVRGAAGGVARNVINRLNQPPQGVSDELGPLMFDRAGADQLVREAAQRARASGVRASVSDQWVRGLLAAEGQQSGRARAQPGLLY